jgi:hypothetical protein
MIPFRWLSLGLVALMATWLTCAPVAAAPTSTGLLSRYAVVVVVNDLPGSHVVSYNWPGRKLDGPGDRAVFFFPPGNYVLLNLDGKPNAFYHIGYTQPGLKVIYSSWFQSGPL